MRVKKIHKCFGVTKYTKYSKKDATELQESAKPGAKSRGRRKKKERRRRRKKKERRRRRKKSNAWRGRRSTGIDWKSSNIECPRGDDPNNWIVEHRIQKKTRQITKGNDRNKLQQIKKNGELPPILCANIPGIKWEFNTKNMEIRSISKEGTNSMPFLVGSATELSLGEGQKQSHMFSFNPVAKLKKMAAAVVGLESRNANRCSNRHWVAGNLKRVTRGKVCKMCKAKLEKATPGFIKINTRTKGIGFPRGGLRHRRLWES